MSTIEMMGIQGIRSFGPDKDDFQRVKFFKPLTLVLGPNGTGKTTIIECLKYAATGDMPPGSKGAGAAFVHDPKLAKEREIKGQIKLMIRDVTGAGCTVERSMTAKVKDGKGKKVEMKTLDGVLTRKNADGENQSITSRCADLNREMIGALGVSKAVLENVIFCHQEDSNWPLSEGKALKDKFDAIFASTRYTKALDEIKKLKQSQDQDIREGKKELEYLKQLKNKSEELERDLEELETKLAASEDSVEKVKEELKPTKEKLNDISVRYNDIYKLQTSRQKLVSEKEQIEKTIKDLEDKIKEDFKGTTTELKKELKDFSKQVQEKREELSEYEEQQKQLAVTLEKLGKEKSTLLVTVGKLENEAEIHAGNIEKRDKKIYELAQLYEFDEFDDDAEIDDDKYRLFFQLMKAKLETMMNKTRRKKAEFEDSESKLQAKIDKLKENKTRLEHSEKMKKEAIAKNDVEIKDINQKLGQMKMSAGRLKTLATDLARAEHELQTTEASVNMDEVKTEIADLDRQRKDLSLTLNELNAEMNQIHKQSEVQTKLEMLVANQQEKEVTINRLKAEHEDNIISLLGHMPVDNLRESVSTYISNQTESVNKSNKVLNELRTKLSTKQGEKIAASAQLRQKEDELRSLEDKINNVCDSQDVDEEFTEVQRNLTQAQEEKGSLLGAEHMIKKYIKNLEKNNPSCPLCQRGFEQAQEVRELILKLQEQMRKVPANMRKAEEDMARYQEKYDAIVALRPVKETVTTLRDKDIPKLKTTLKKIDEDMKKIKDEVENKGDECSMQEGDLQTAKSFQPDIVDMDRRRGEVRELERKIGELRASLAGGGLGRSMDEVLKEKEEKQLELDNLNRTLDHRREKLADYQEKTQKQRSKVHALQGEKLTIEGELQQRTKLEERKATLDSENKNNARDIDDARTQLKPIEKQIEKLVEEKDGISAEKEVMMETARGEVDSVKGRGNEVKNLNNEIKGYMQSGRSEELEESKGRQSKLSKQQKEKQEALDEINTVAKRLSNEISNQQIRERELQDSLSLRSKQEDVKNLDIKIADLEKQLGGLELKSLERERQKLLEIEDSLTQKLHNAAGRQQGFKDQIKSTRKELQSEMYRDASKKYSSKIIENKTTEIVNGDLQKYYGAMDRAIMMYHKSKMEEINIIIQELWRNTYTGNDIETIEIQSEADDAATTSTIKNRRNYNYRVVMIRNGVPIDMRGRCSAGQKVLASLIIRLALAETFCVNCGVLALDEPTTNLDRSNIESLAFALVKIIKERSNQRHFQLVVITHDEDFVELLGRSEYVDEYMEVSKNSEGVSRLTTKKVEELHSR